MKSVRKPDPAGILRTLLISTAAALSLLPFAGSSALAQTADQPLGEVQFDTSCDADAEAAFARGLTLLHHMMYAQSEAVFASAMQQSPDCAMLPWGQAMSYFHPLWPGQISPDDMAKGKAAAAKMQGAGEVSGVEQALIDAAAAFYAADDMGYRDRIAAWAAAQAKAYEGFSDNVDVAAFHGLAQLATAPRGDKTAARQDEVGKMLETQLAQAPLHPGLYHYIIHAYDNPALSERGLPFADGYGQITPDVPHALHMPSHIFVRQGIWDEAITWNTRSAEAALAQPMGEVVSSHYAHAMDYLIYSHLQRGETDIAQALLDEFVGVTKQQNNFGSAYALAASPVRLLLEQENWAEAAAYPTTLHPAITWDRFPQCVAITWFARGLGAARSGNMDQAQSALDELATLKDRMTAADQGYWAQLTDAQMKSIEGWMAFHQGDKDGAIASLSEAADIEDAAGKSPVTPGHVLPARELLGDLYAQLGQTDLAAEAYAQTLELAPNRQRSLQALN